VLALVNLIAIFFEVVGMIITSLGAGFRYMRYIAKLFFG